MPYDCGLIGFLVNDRERITFDLKPPHKNTPAEASHASRPKMIIKTTVPLLNSPKQISQTVTSPTSESSKTVPSVSASKLSSTGYLLSSQKRNLGNNVNGSIVNGINSIASSLVPYVDDSDASDSEPGDMSSSTLTSSKHKNGSSVPSVKTASTLRNGPSSQSDSKTNGATHINNHLGANRSSIDAEGEKNGKSVSSDSNNDTQVASSSSGAGKTGKSKDGWHISDSSDENTNSSSSSSFSRSESRNFIVSDKSDDPPRDKKKKKDSIIRNWGKVSNCKPGKKPARKAKDEKRETSSTKVEEKIVTPPAAVKRSSRKRKASPANREETKPSPRESKKRKKKSHKLLDFPIAASSEIPPLQATRKRIVATPVPVSSQSPNVSFSSPAILSSYGNFVFLSLLRSFISPSHIVIYSCIILSKNITLLNVFHSIVFRPVACLLKPSIWRASPAFFPC